MGTDAAPGAWRAFRDQVQYLWLKAVGPRGWRSLIGPAAFAIFAILLLLYDHLHTRVPQSVFWLALALIVAVFARMLETNRKQSETLLQQQLGALSDRVTGLRNRIQLEADIGAALQLPNPCHVLLLLDFDDLQAYSDRFGYSAGDELVRRIAAKLVDAVMPLGGNAYRVDARRLALLMPVGDRQPESVVLAAISSLRNDGPDLSIGWAHGEATVPDEAADAEAAMRLAGQRLTAHNQRQHHSARRQAHAVLIAALSARRPELRERLRAVAYRAISLARRLGLDREAIDDIALAAELHDIGLLSVPEVVLEKESPLSEDEQAMIRSGSSAGEKIIGAAPGLASVATLVRSSTEHFDGSGYPDGLAGEAIPLGSRIIAVAVAFAAMTAPRPRRSANQSFEETLAELRRCAGSQFDPRVVEALAKDLAEELAATAPSSLRQTVG